MLTVLAVLTITLLTILTIAVLLTVLTIFGMKKKKCFLVLFRWLTCLAVAYQCAPYTLNGELVVRTLRFYCMEVQTNL